MRKKRIYLEFLRIVSAMLVIFNHTPGYALYQTTGGYAQGFYMFLSMFTRINVPIFFMISGALLLDKEQESYGMLFKKRISKTLAVLLTFEILMCVWQKIIAFSSGSEFDASFIHSFMEGTLKGTGAYWYLYAYVGLLFCLPFMRRIAREMNGQDFVMILTTHFVLSSLIPLMNIALSFWSIEKLSISANFEVPFATIKAFFYPLIGYYLDKRIDIRHIQKKHLIALIMTMTVGIWLQCICTKYEAQISGKCTEKYVYLFDYISAMTVFLITKYLFEVKLHPNCNENVFAAICTIGSVTLGIYLLEPFLREMFYYRFFNSICVSFGLPVIVRSFIWCGLSMLLCGGITLILKKLPVFNKLL